MIRTTPWSTWTTRPGCKSFGHAGVASPGRGVARRLVGVFHCSGPYASAAAPPSTVDANGAVRRGRPRSLQRTAQWPARPVGAARRSSSEELASEGPETQAFRGFDGGEADDPWGGDDRQEGASGAGVEGRASVESRATGGTGAPGPSATGGATDGTGTPWTATGGATDVTGAP